MCLSKALIGWYGDRNSQSNSEEPAAAINSWFPFFLASSVSAHFLGSLPEWLWRHLPDLHLPHGETHNQQGMKKTDRWNSLVIVHPLDSGKSSSQSSYTSLFMKVCWPVKGFGMKAPDLHHELCLCPLWRWSMWLDWVWEGSWRWWMQTANCLGWGSPVSVAAFHFTLCSVCVSKTSSKNDCQHVS